LLSITEPIDEPVDGKVGAVKPSGPMPYTPSNPSPKNGATGVSINPTLSWNGGDSEGGNITYDIYLEMGDSTPDEKIATIKSRSYNVSYKVYNLEYGKTYYWKVIAKNDNGSAIGPVWKFTTKRIEIIKVAIYNVSELEKDLHGKYMDKHGSEKWNNTGTYGMKKALLGYTFTINETTYKFEPHILEAKNISNGALQTGNYKILLAPGDDDYFHDVSNYPNLRSKIVKFVENGGGYIGTCGGAEFACKGIRPSNAETNSGLITLGIVNAYAYTARLGHSQYFYKSIMNDSGSVDEGNGSGVSDWGGIPMVNIIKNAAGPFEDYNVNEEITLRY